MWFASLLRCLKSGPRRDRGRRPKQQRLRFLPRVECLEGRALPSTFTVENLADGGPGSLRAAITAANANPGADLIDFAPGLQGTVTLTSGELKIELTATDPTGGLTIDGPGAARLAVSGNDASRVLNIAGGAVVSIDDLTITHGRGFLQGGGILNAGNLTLSRAVVSDNVVVGRPGATPADAGQGGGIRSTGALNVLYTTFVNNRALGGDGNPGGTGSTGIGGAIMSAGIAPAPSSANVSHCTFRGNEAVGGTAGAGATFTFAGVGGAITNVNGSMAVSHSLFRDNQAIGGAGGASAGSTGGVGGAIANVANLADANLTVSHCTLTGNRAVGGATHAGTSPQPGRGGGIANYVRPGAAPGSLAATASIEHCILLGNQAVGGTGPTGGTGQGGGIANEFGGVITVTDSAILLNRAIGGAGTTGNGGNGLGGGIFNGPADAFGTPSLTLVGGVVALNRADGGAADSGSSAGLGVGGGLYVGPGSFASADLTAIFANDASTSDDDVFGILV